MNGAQADIIKYTGLIIAIEEIETTTGKTMNIKPFGMDEKACENWHF